MAHLYFHCANPECTLVDCNGSDVADTTDALDHAEAVVHACLAKPGPEDWRSWTVRVSDAEGEELFELPFAAVLGRPH